MSLVERREGVEAGRLDNFVDGVFAFTLTLLAIGGDNIPDSSVKLLHLLRDIPASAMCFLQIALMWHGHVRWRHLFVASTRAGLVLSLMLVFFALIFVYPVHMVYASLCNVISAGALSPEFHLASPNDVRAVFATYGLAYACMSGTLTALFRHAAIQARSEGRDGHQAMIEMVAWSIPAGVGSLSALVALLLPDNTPDWLWSLPGSVYFLMMLTGPIMKRYRLRHQIT